MTAETGDAVAMIELTRAFLRDEITAASYDVRFRTLFSASYFGADQATFRVLERLAVACDDYVADPDLRDTPDDLDEHGLRAAGRAALAELGLT